MEDEIDEAKMCESVAALSLALERVMKGAHNLCALLNSLDEVERNRIFGDSLDGPNI